MIDPQGERPSMEELETRKAEAEQQMADEDNWRAERAAAARQAKANRVHVRFGDIFWPVVTAQLFVGFIAWILLQLSK